MKRNRILLVDADGDCEELLSEAAAQAGHELRCVRTAAEAFTILDREIRQLAAVIVDVDPGAHGLVLLEAINSCAERPPMLVLTALEETYMEPIAKGHGALTCLGKPIGAAKLQAALREMCLQRSVSCDVWGHPTTPPADAGFRVKAAVRGILRKMSISATKNRQISEQVVSSLATRCIAESPSQNQSGGPRRERRKHSQPVETATAQEMRRSSQAMERLIKETYSD